MTPTPTTPQASTGLPAGLQAGMDFFLVPSMDGHLNDRAPGEAFQTQFGVTYMTYEYALKQGVQMKPWTEWTTGYDAAPIYKRDYWDVLNCDKLPACVAMVAFVDSTLMGTATVARNLQFLVGVEEDGDIGPETLAEVAKATPAVLAGGLERIDLQHLRSLPTWSKFGHGWETRETQLLTAALKLA